MDLWSILKTVGTGVIASVAGPAAPLVLGAINAVLPDDAQLPPNATGQQAQDAMASIPADQRAALMDRQFDIEELKITKSYDSNKAMLEADAIQPQTTRPYIAKHSFHVVGFTCVVTILLWSYGIIEGDKDMVETVVDGWPFLLAAIGPLVVLLHAYFGVLKSEQKNKLDAANGSTTPNGIGGLIAGLINRNGK